MDAKTILKGAKGQLKIALGINRVSDSEYAKRLSICNECEKREMMFSSKYNINIARCSECKCPIRSKALLQDEICDLGKWPTI